MNAEMRTRLQLVRWLDGDDDAALDNDAAAALEPWIQQHVLAPLAYRRGMSRFRGDYAATAIMAELAERRLAEVLAAMARQGVRVVLLKGIAYAHDLYDDPGERAMADIDLLVRPEQRGSANAVMRGLGYVAAAESRFHHATMFQRGDTEVFDVHWAIVSPWRSRIDIDAVWRRVREQDDHLRLNKVDEILFHFVNMARNGMLDTLVHYIDAARLLRRLNDDDIQTLPARARQYRVARAVTAGIYLSHCILPCANAPSAPRWLPRAWLQDIVDGKQVAGLELVRRKLVLADGTRERAGHVVQWLLEQPARWSSK